MCQILSGKEVAERVKQQVKEKIERHKLKVTLAVVIVGNDPASKIYVRNKTRACEYCGIKVITQKLPEDIIEKELLTSIDMWNKSEINGILVQLPLPKHIDKNKIILAIFMPYRKYKTVCFVLKIN